MLKEVVDHRQPQDVQLAALGALGRIDEAGAASVILDAWPALSPRLRSQATESLFARADRLPTLLDAIATGQFRPTDLDPATCSSFLPILMRPSASVPANFYLA